jgi:hypothetical protein
MSRPPSWRLLLAALALTACGGDSTPKLIQQGRGLVPVAVVGDGVLAYADPAAGQLSLVDPASPGKVVRLAPLPADGTELETLAVRNALVFRTEANDEAPYQVSAWTPRTGVFPLGANVSRWVGSNRPDPYMTADGRWLLVWELGEDDPSLEAPPLFPAYQLVAWDVSASPPVRKPLAPRYYSSDCGLQVRGYAQGDARVLVSGCLQRPGFSAADPRRAPYTHSIRTYDASRDFEESLLHEVESPDRLAWAWVPPAKDRLFVQEARALHQLRFGGAYAEVLGTNAVAFSRDGKRVVGLDDSGLSVWENDTVVAEHALAAELLFAVDPAARVALVSTAAEWHGLEEEGVDPWLSWNVALVDLQTGKVEPLLAAPASTLDPEFSPDGSVVFWGEAGTAAGLNTLKVRPVTGKTATTVATGVASAWFDADGALMADADYAGPPGYAATAKASVVRLKAPYDGAPAVVATGAVRGAMGTSEGRYFFVQSEGKDTDGIYFVELR